MSKLEEFFANKNWEFEDDWNYIGDIDPQDAAAELKELQEDARSADEEHAKLVKLSDLYQALRLEYKVLEERAETLVDVGETLCKENEQLRAALKEARELTETIEIEAENAIRAWRDALKESE